MPGNNSYVRENCLKNRVAMEENVHYITASCGELRCRRDSIRSWAISKWKQQSWVTFCSDTSQCRKDQSCSSRIPPTLRPSLIRSSSLAHLHIQETLIGKRKRKNLCALVALFWLPSDLIHKKRKYGLHICKSMYTQGKNFPGPERAVLDQKFFQCSP